MTAMDVEVTTRRQGLRAPRDGATAARDSESIGAPDRFDAQLERAHGPLARVTNHNDGWGFAPATPIFRNLTNEMLAALETPDFQDDGHLPGLPSSCDITGTLPRCDNHNVG